MAYFFIIIGAVFQRGAPFLNAKNGERTEERAYTDGMSD